MRYFLIAATFFVLLAVVPSRAQSLVFQVHDSDNITGYEAGSLRAPIAFRQVLNNEDRAIDLIELVFTSTIPLDPNTVGAAMVHTTNGLRGKIISTGSFVDTAGLHVMFGRGFGRMQKGLNLPAQSWQQEIVIFADLPMGVTADLKLSLVSYQAKYSRRRELPTAQAVLENGYLYRLVPPGTTGFLGIKPITLTLTNHAQPVPLFRLSSVTAQGFVLYGYPTWRIWGIGASSTSGGITPGSYTDIQISANLPAEEVGTYYGTQLIGPGYTGICMTVPMTITVR